MKKNIALGITQIQKTPTLISLMIDTNCSIVFLGNPIPSGAFAFDKVDRFSCSIKVTNLCVSVKLVILHSLFQRNKASWGIFKMIDQKIINAALPFFRVRTNALFTIESTIQRVTLFFNQHSDQKKREVQGRYD